MSILFVRRLRLGLGAAALVLATGGIAHAAPPRLAAAAPTPVPTVTPLPVAPQTRVAPTPFPINTPGPLPGDESLPYPAYGVPVPGVDAGVSSPGIPATVTLQQAIAIGFARSPALAAARADVGIQAAAARLTGAGLLPSLSATASLDRSHSQPGGNSLTTTTTGTTTGNGTGTNPGTGTGTGNSGTSTTTAARVNTPNVTSASFGLQLRQLIFDGGRIAASVRAARRNETAFADTYRRQLQVVAYNVAVAYYNYLAAQRTRQVDLEIVRQDLTQENLVRAQVRAGTEAAAQIATVQLTTAQSRLAVIRAQSTELSDGAAFANALGLDANIRVQPVDDAPVFTSGQASTLPIPSYDTAVKRALALRPDYDSALQSIAQANETLRAAKLGLFPTLSGSASAQDASTDSSLGAFRNANSIGISLTLPIFDQGQTADNVASARASIDRATANAQTTSLGIALAVKQALTGLVSSQAALVQTQQEYATAITNVRSTQAQYRAGVTTLPLLLNAQVQLAQALTDQVTAVYALRQAEQTYLFAAGSNYDTSASLGSREVAPIPVTPVPMSSGAAIKGGPRI